MPIVEMIDLSFTENSNVIEKELSILQNGNQLDILISISHISHKRKNESAVSVMIQDITHIVRSKRAVAWAGMAQRLAHEIKTPLSSVMLAAQRLQINDSNQDTTKYVTHIIGQVDRLCNMTDAFLKFACIEKPNVEPIDLNKMILETLEEDRLRIGERIKVETFLASDLPRIFADRQQVLIIMKNLIDNSINAMGSSGTLTIKTRLVQSLQSMIYENEAVQIEISDTGKGISEENLKYLFQPFFSKAEGGTGMGLVIVKKIIEDHKGTIRIKSEEDIGTTVFVNLPMKG